MMYSEILDFHKLGDVGDDSGNGDEYQQSAGEAIPQTA